MGRKDVIWLDEKLKLKDLHGKLYVVTGANSGIGLETTRQLIKQGAHVVMACRRTTGAEEVARSFSELKGSFEVMKLDLADLQSVRDFVSKYNKKHDKLDGLICNAGMVSMGNKVQRTKDGLEMTIGVSFFAHFLLTELLLDILKKSNPSRMIIVSSVVHAGNKKNRHDVHLEDLNYRKRKYNNFTAYSEAKLATILYALELSDRLKGTGVTTASVHPGWARSNFGKGGSLITKMIMAILGPLTGALSNSNEESAQTTLHCLLSDEVPNHSGAYFSQQSVLYSDKECKKGGWPMISPNPNARNLDKAKKLTAISREIVGLA